MKVVINITFGLLILFSMACNNKIMDKMDTQKIDRIEYRFTDSSTPPRYHRSYNIVVSTEKIDFSVDVYGTVLVDTTFSFNKEKFNILKEKISLLEELGEKISKGATGTKGRDISLHEGSEKIYQLYWDSLNKVSDGTNEFVKSIKDLIPDLGGFLNTELPER